VDGTGSGSCPVAGVGISCVEPSGSSTRELVRSLEEQVIKMTTFPTKKEPPVFIG
jgi:hypothetical protein